MAPGSWFLVRPRSLVRPWSVVLWSGVALVASVQAATEADVQLIAAVKQRQPAVVRQLIAKHADVNSREVDGTTALHWAVRADDGETTQMLLRAGANAG